MHDLAGESEECFHGLDGPEVLIDFDDRLEDCSFAVPAAPNVRCGNARNREPVGARADAVGDEKARIHSMGRFGLRDAVQPKVPPVAGTFSPAFREGDFLLPQFTGAGEVGEADGRDDLLRVHHREEVVAETASDFHGVVCYGWLSACFVTASEANKSGFGVW